MWGYGRLWCQNPSAQGCKVTDEPRSVETGYPAQGKQNSGCAPEQRLCPGGDGASGGHVDKSLAQRPGGDSWDIPWQWGYLWSGKYR